MQDKGDDTPVEWIDAKVAAVWADGSFRVRIDIDNSKEDGSWCEDCALPCLELPSKRNE